MPKSQDDKWRADQVNATIHDFVAEGIIVDGVVVVVVVVVFVFVVVVLCILGFVFNNWRKNIFSYQSDVLDSVKKLLNDYQLGPK